MISPRTSLPRRLVAVVLLAVAGFQLGGCGDEGKARSDGSGRRTGEAAAPAASGAGIERIHDGEAIVELDRERPIAGRMVYRYSFPISSLNGLSASGRGDRQIIRYHLNLPLLEYHPEELQPMPWLAASLPAISADGLEQTWEIRPEATWADGSPVSAADFVATWRLLNEPSLRNATAILRASLGPVATIEALDPHRFKVRLNESEPMAAYALGFNLAPVKSADLPDDLVALARMPVLEGCGPYRVERLDEQGCRLVRRQPWWGDALPSFANRWRLAEFEYKVVPDSVQAVEQLRKGLIDFYVGDVREYLSLFAKGREKGFGSAHYYLSQFSYLGFNCRKEPFDDVRVRQALAQLVPRERINEQVIGGIGRAVSGPFFKGSIYEDPSLEPWDYRPARAKALLEEAGFADHDGDGLLDRNGRAFRFTLTRTVGGRAFSDGLVDRIKESLAQVGLDMNIEDLDAETAYGRYGRGEFDAYVEVWPVDPVFPQLDLFDLYHSSQIAGGYNWQKFADPELDPLLLFFRRSQNEVKRIEAGRKIHRILHEQQPMIFLFNNPSCVVWNERIAGVQIHPLGVRQWDFRIAD
ncbi:MAG: hypothetical protein H6807_09905 [Planctomycetes bacterium]|nr:hypothetical protein [Planctomycetota bacterium]